MSVTLKVWWSICWYWTLPALGAEIGMHLGKDAPRWFKLELKLLFLWLQLHIDGVSPEPKEQDQ